MMKAREKKGKPSYHELFTLLEPPQERRQGANIHGVGEYRHEMVQNTGNLAKQGANPLGTVGNLNVQQLLDGQGKALLVCHHGDVIQTVEVGKGLQIGLVFDELLCTTVEETDVRVGANDLLSIELENQTQHAVGSGMLGTEVDSVVPDPAVVDRVLARLLVRSGLEGGGAIGVALVLEVIVDGDEASAHGLGSGISACAGRREGAGGQTSRAKAKAPSTSASESR